MQRQEIEQILNAHGYSLSGSAVIFNPSFNNNSWKVSEEWELEIEETKIGFVFTAFNTISQEFLKYTQGSFAQNFQATIMTANSRK